MTKKPSVLSLGLGAALAVLAIGNAPAVAGGFNFGSGTLSDFTGTAAKNMIKTVGIGADYRSYRSATPLGMVIGLDLGVDVTAISVPDEFKTAMSLAGNTADIPTLLPLPRISAHKGLPFGVDIGASYIGYGDYKIVGGEVSYAPLPGGLVLPAVAIRASYNHADLSYIKANTTKFDVVVSKKLAFVFDPYVGAGIQMVKGTLDIPVAQLPTTVSAKQSVTAGHVFVGFPLKLLVVNLTPEFDHSFAGMNTYGMKLSLGF
jgi:hypothetical protein